jgi:hypothetical protein
MKKLLHYLGVLMLCLIVLGIGAFMWGTTKGKRLDRESKAYVDQALPAIVRTLDLNELKNLASPEFMKVVKPDDLKKMFDRLAQLLGPLKEYKGSRGDSNVKLSFHGEKKLQHLI